MNPDNVEPATVLPPISAVEVLRLDPGDIIAVHVETQITAEQAQQIKFQVESITRHEVIVLAGGMHLTVIEPDDV
jgi:hypothetical protein